jgi:hypothetical protein
MSLLNKYLKYQNKYLELTGGNKKNAKEMFVSAINKRYDVMKDILRADNILKVTIF